MVAFGLTSELEVADFSGYPTHVVDANAAGSERVGLPRLLIADNNSVRYHRNGATASTFSLEKQVGQPSDNVTCLGFAPPECALVGFTSGGLSLYHLRKFVLLDTFSDIKEKVEAVCWHGGLLRPYDKFLNYEVWTGTKTSVSSWKVVKTGQRPEAIFGHRQSYGVEKIKWKPIDGVTAIQQMTLPDGQPVMEREATVVSAAKGVYLLDAQLKTLAVLRVDGCTVCTFAAGASMFEASLVTGHASGEVRVWSLVTANDATALRSLVNFSEERQEAEGVGGTETDEWTERLVHEFLGHTLAVRTANFIGVEGTETRAQRGIPRAEKSALGVKHASLFLATVAVDDSLRVWSLELFTQVYSLALGLVGPRVALFPLGGGLIAFADRGSVSVRRLSTEFCVPFLHTSASPLVAARTDASRSKDARRAAVILRWNSADLVKD
jgi:hypothetical protein